MIAAGFLLDCPIPRIRGVAAMPQQDRPDFALIQVAATLAAGMLSSRNPQSWSPDLDRNAAYATEVYHACLRALRANPPGAG
jgi:hypothetical protein